MKCCTKCNIEKSIEYFSKSIKNVDGYSTICKNCCSIANKIYKNLKKQNATKNCKVCNKPFPIKNSKVCSKECSKQNKLNNYLISKSKITCKVCNIIFIGKKSQTVCSKECKIIIKKKQTKLYKNKFKKEISCKNCNVVFTPLNSRIGTCSLKCRDIVSKHFKTIYNINNKEILNKNAKIYRKTSKEKVRKSVYKSRRKHIEKRRENTRNWNKNNRDRIKNNPKYKYYRSLSDLRRRKAEKAATPSWLSESMKLEINKIYKECSRLSKENSIKYHVDHIIPLKGKNVCGLHVPWNLQILSAEENLKKGNKLL